VDKKGRTRTARISSVRQVPHQQGASLVTIAPVTAAAAAAPRGTAVTIAVAPTTVAIAVAVAPATVARIAAAVIPIP
jgi:hypothetical protein